MRCIKTTYRTSIRTIATVLVMLFGMHVFSIHSYTEALIYCFEEDGNVNIESEAGPLLSIPEEGHLHVEKAHQHDTPTFDAAENNHHDVALSLVCSKEQKITRFDQNRTLKFLDSILQNAVDDLPQSRAFQFISFIPPKIENIITASLQTVVLLN